MEVSSSPPRSAPQAKKAKVGETSEHKPYHLLDLTRLDSQLFRDFYKAYIPEEEFDEFMSTLQTELPGTFRVCGSRGDITAVINSRVQKLADLLNNAPTYPINDQLSSKDSDKVSHTTLIPNVDEIKPAMKQLAWYPGGNAWQVHAGRHTLRKQDDSLAQQLRTFLIEETNVGHLSRQEAVSMVPPLFLQTSEHHRVLDMCAAPGSKTSQLIEMLHRDAPEEYNNDQSSSSSSLSSPGYQGIVRGVVHANDSDSKGCNTLITQTKRLNSPSLIVTNHDAQFLPTIRIKVSNPVVSSLSSEMSKDDVLRNQSHYDAGVPLLYDRILCDVPCSGDGTLRKNADLWSRWLPTSGSALHFTQLSILNRAIGISAPGARIVYSTCSLNPAEDEAVIAAAILQSNGKIRLVDVSDQLPLLKRRPGLHTWKFMDAPSNWYSTYEELPESLTKKFLASSFPPTPQVAQEIHLEHCMRFYPHDQDTGGFFIAVLERVESLTADELKPKKKKYLNNIPPAAYKKLPSDRMESIFPSLKDFYDLKESFFSNQLISHGDAVSMVYLTTYAGSLLLENDEQNRMKLKSVGIRIFEKLGNAQDSPCVYRTTQDGIEPLYPFLGEKRVVELKEASDLETLLTAEDPLISEAFTEETKEKLSNMQTGSVVYSYHLGSNEKNTQEGNKTDESSKDSPKHHILVVGWRGKVSTHLLLKTIEKQSILSALKENT